MEKADLDRFDASLTTLRSELRSQLEEQGANPDDDIVSTDFDAGFADSAHATAERDRVLALIERLRGQFAAVDAALGKIAAGTFGVCERCGNDIAVERLEALPYSTLCITCVQDPAS